MKAQWLALVVAISACSNNPSEPPESPAPDAGPACEPDRRACNTDGTAIEACTAGQIETVETCAAGCIDELGQPHCRAIVPLWLSSTCSAAATQPDYVAPFVLDISKDTACTGGMIGQPGGPDICVVRARSIQVNDSTVRGGQSNRAVAFVADDVLAVDGKLDVSADGTTNGPGGGFASAGGAVDTQKGGGGAGFKQIGGAGGSSEFMTGGAGGDAFDPLARSAFGGGPRARAGAAIFNSIRPAPGGGGGGVLLVSCKGTVIVRGIVDAGGGGGGGGRDIFPIQGQTSIDGGAGGGAGGYVVLQGIQVIVNGAIYANGGAGGGGCTGDNCIGASGQDASVAGVGGAGGVAADQASGAGGRGGTSTTAPTSGAGAGGSPGGGGGATGRIQLYTPSGTTPVVSSAIEPPPETNRTIPLR